MAMELQTWLPTTTQERGRSCDCWSEEEQGAIMAYLRNKSMEFLKRFEVPAKNPSEDAQRRWREAVGTLVKNRRRRFRMVPDLDKRSQVETQRRNIQVRTPSSKTHLAIS